MNISLVIIAKDEEGGLRKCIESAKPIVNEIIIGVDSKSKDSTLKIAKELGDIVYEFEWENNFSKARNEALDKSHGNWNLILDGHEYIEQYPEMDLIDIPEGTDSMQCELTMENGEVVASCRILRNDIRYEKPVHNETKVKQPLLLHDLKIKHDRHQQSKERIWERNKQRKEMNEDDMKEDTYRSHYYLGQLYRGEDAKKSVKHYKRALELVHKGVNPISVKLCKYYLAQMLYEDGQLIEAFAQLDEELMEFSYLAGMMHFREKEYGFAIAQFLEAFTVPKLETSSRPVKDIEFEIYDVLSQCFYELKQMELAKTAATKALTYKKDKRVEGNLEIFSDNEVVEEKGKEYYDRIFKGGYDTTRYKDMYKVIMKELEKNKSSEILEIGCGVGSLGKQIFDAGYKYRGFDFSEEAINEAKKISPANFHIGDVYDKKQYEGDYDIIVATEVYEHIDDLKAMENIPSGVKLIASVPNFKDPAHLRTYSSEAYITDRFKDLLEINKIYFSSQTGIYIIIAIKQ